ncbi:MAG: hypothetical protein FWF44_12280, partial [Defluviitaleaceae bacterium]|nr:hypothetical protein [Defluviitaleaceae bacterium]
SFAAGDMATLVLSADGEIAWAWGAGPDETNPGRREQRDCLVFLRNTNAWRTGAAKKYLHTGIMVKPLETRGVKMKTLAQRKGQSLTDGAVLTSCWRADDGSCGQVFVNYGKESAEFTVRTPGMEEAGVMSDPRTGFVTKVRAEENGEFHLSAAPLSAVWFLL